MSTPGTPSKRNKCHHCGEAIDAQFIRVNKYKFHKDHFVCKICNTSLLGHKFRHKEGKFYCVPDFVKHVCHECHHCKEKIKTGTVIQAFGGYYHPHHFVCANCSKSFEDGKYYESGAKPFCQDCFVDKDLEKCATCGDPIISKDLVRVQGNAYHSKCLSCDHCGMPLASKGSIYQKDGRVYCRADYFNFFCKRCTACSEHIMSLCISVNDENYHPDCLKCRQCSKTLDKYICIEGSLLCVEHSESDMPPFVCDLCNKAITGEGEVRRCVGKKVHAACFKCFFCTKELKKVSANLRDDCLCCPDCLVRQDDDPVIVKALHTGLTRRPSQLLSETRSVALEDVPEVEEEGNSLAAPPRRRGRSGSKMKRRKSGLRAPSNKSIKWKKGELLGKGSFGKVYMGMNIETGELIAVKQVRLQTDEDHEQAKAIQSEIEMMQSLRHENIVALLGTSRVGNKLNILMEYVPAKSLDTILDRFGPFPESVMRNHVLQLLRALAYCHGKGVVHRDIKGKNILRDTAGNVKLADFGSAKRFDNVLSKDAPSVSYNYTPLWTAPEVLTGNYNAKVDVWSLGCVIVEMATGNPPWDEEKFENPFRALYHIGNSKATPVIPDSLSDSGKDFLRKTLERNPDERPSAKELLSHPWVQIEDTSTGGGGDMSSDEEEEEEEDALAASGKVIEGAAS